MTTGQCSRCHANISLEGSAPVETGMTCGYYDVRSGFWAQFARALEQFLCDACMWADPRYVALYGDFSKWPAEWPEGTDCGKVSE